jgi:hypothetical protein
MRLGLLGLVAVGLASAGAAAQDGPFDKETTAELASICASAEPTDSHFCYGFMLGAGQFYTEILRAELIQPMACPDPAPTIAEMRVAFIDWVAANPEAGETRAIDGMMQAAAETWPCS